MDMSRLPHVKDEPQAFKKLLCFSVIMFKSQMPKENIKILSILIKEEKIELFNNLKKKTIKLSNKGKVTHSQTLWKIEMWVWKWKWWKKKELGYVP